MSNTKLFVGNLPYSATENDLEAAFSQYGVVLETRLMLDRDTGRPRGFAFVTMETKEGAEAAIKALHGANFQGRDLTVNEARPREERAGGGGGAGGYRGGGGGDRGDRGGFRRDRGNRQ